MNKPGDSQSIIYNIVVSINRFILFVYLFELAVKWLGIDSLQIILFTLIRYYLDDFTNFWYLPVNILEFLLTLISMINFINEIYFDSTQSNNSTQTMSQGNTIQKIRFVRLIER